VFGNIELKLSISSKVENIVFVVMKKKTLQTSSKLKFLPMFGGSAIIPRITAT